MRIEFWAFIWFIVVFLCLFAAVLAFNVPTKPPPLVSIISPFKNVDFGDLPAVETYAARDGALLGYRTYEGAPSHVVVLIHGSSDDGIGMHPLAGALHAAGASIVVPVLRGHDLSRPIGDIGYIGQLEDDLVDLVAMLRIRYPNASYTLIGFSAGGGFVLRVMAGLDECLFQHFILISPALPRGVETNRPGAGGWVSLAWPRIVALVFLNKIGIDWFNSLSVVAFATSPQAPNLTGFYSFRLAINFGAPRQYLLAFQHTRKPTALLVGGADEIFYPERFAPLLRPVRPDLDITIVPGIGHTGMTVAPAGIAAVREKFLNMISVAPR